MANQLGRMYLSRGLTDLAQADQEETQHPDHGERLDQHQGV
jgi:hypothetical protein